jgi:small-conductance mechanosensitive channel
MDTMRRIALLFAVASLPLAPAVAGAQEADLKNAAKIVEFIRFGGVVRALIFIAIAVGLLWFVSRITTRLGERFTHRRLVLQQVSTILRFSIYLVTFIVVIKSMFKLERETVLALTGTIAVSVGFALKDLAASVLAGITILFDRPFQVGDRVTFAGQYGEIKSIGLRSVRMVTLDDSLVTIPNNKFLTDLVASGNAGSVEMMIQMDFFIGLDQDLGRAKQIVTESLTSSRYFSTARPWSVTVAEVAQDSYLALRLRAKAYVLDVRFEKAFETDVTERVIEGFRADGIEAPAIIHRAR